MKAKRKSTAGQDLAEYGIALAVVGTFAIAASLAIRTDVFLLWLLGAIKVFVIAAS